VGCFATKPLVVRTVAHSCGVCGRMRYPVMPLRIPTTFAVAITFAGCGERQPARVTVDARRDAPLIDARVVAAPDAPDPPSDAPPTADAAPPDAAIDAYVVVDAAVDAPDV